MNITSLLASSIPSSSAFFEPRNKLVHSYLRCCEPNPWSKPFDQNFIKFNQSFQNEPSPHKHHESRLNPTLLFKRNQTVPGYLPSLIPNDSIDPDIHDPVKSPFTSLPRLRQNSSVDSPRYRVSLYSSQSYHNENLDKYLSPPAYLKDNLKSDVSWEAKIPDRERNYGRDYFTLDLKDETCSSLLSSTNELYQKAVRRRKTVDSEESFCTIVEGVKSALHMSPNQAFKDQLEGKVVAPKFHESSGIVAIKEISNQKSKQNEFRKCQSRSSATSNEAVAAAVSSENDIIDDVFDSPGLKLKSKLPKASKKKPISPKVKPCRRSSNLETSPTKTANKSVESKSRNSSVTINDCPEYLAGKTSTKSSKIASSDAIAKLITKPSRGSLKKSPNNSDYDRDRGRSRHMDSGHRESFKKNDRTNERGSDQDRDLSDRELKDGSFNRSLSNTDTNLEDRIGNK